MQKKLVCLLVFLMASSFVFPFDAVNAAGATIFVDGDNAVGPWDGSHDHPFRFIQDGIDAVAENGTVYVSAGVYRENIVIRKSINVNRTGDGNVIIDGRGAEDVVNISAGHVTVRGFTIKNGTRGIIIYNSSGNIIAENTIQDAEYGIFWEASLTILYILIIS
jgi:parallel beta-helix repeat protein